MEGYSCKIAGTSLELDAKAKVKMKDLSNAIAIDQEVPEIGDKLVITPKGWVELAIHNEKSENTDYNVFVIVATDDKKYYTSSESLRTSYMEIADELEADGYTDNFDIEIYRKESKNYKGKGFLTCSLY